MTEIKVGDEVRVFNTNGRRMGQPIGGWPGKVVKVGRVLVTIEHTRGTEVFRLDTRRSNDGYAHGSFMTPEEAAERQRRLAAVEQLRDLGLEIGTKHTNAFTANEVEALVKLVRTFGGQR